jgi:hypothetical protein
MIATRVPTLHFAQVPLSRETGKVRAGPSEGDQSCPAVTLPAT